MKRKARSASRGQGMVEFTLVAPVVLMFIFGVVEFGRYEITANNLNQAVSAGVRFAATHPSAFSNASPPLASTIQGAIRAADSNTSIVNDNTHIQITYWDTTVLNGSNNTECGYYDATAGGGSGAFVAETGYTQGVNCVIPGNFVQISVSVDYTTVTPLVSTLLPNTFVITSTRQLLEEQ